MSSVPGSVVAPDVPASPPDDPRSMSNYLMVMTAEADADQRNRDLLRDLEGRRRAGAPTVHPSLVSRLLAAVQRRHRAAVAH